MQLNNKHITLLLSLCAVFTACSEHEVFLNDTPDGKTPIELSVGSADGPTTRAVVIDGKGKVTAFENDTRLHLLMVSENADDENDKKYTVNYGLAVGSGVPPVDVSNPPTYSAISFDETVKTVKQTHKKSDGTIGDGYYNPANETVSTNPVESNSKDGIVRYWDDAHARKSKLSIYGFCVNGTILPFGAPWNQKIDGIASNTQKVDGTNTWKNSVPSSYKIGAEDNSHNLMRWTIGDHSKSYGDQTFLSVLYKDDICYSNNIKGSDVLKFGNKVTGKFDSGTIEFHRAVSLITVLIKPGQGFTAPMTTDFKFAANKNIAMQGFNKAGYLSLQDGSWSDITTGNWNTICNATVPGNGTNPGDSYYTLMAFVIPGNDLNGDTDAANKTAMVFSIDGNEYKLSKQDLLNALKHNGANCDNGTVDGDVKEDYLTGHTKLKAGIHYQFTLTVGKTEISSINASVVDWKTVTATAEPDNAHALTVDMETSAGGSSTPVASYLYKSSTNAADLSGVEKGYSNNTTDRVALAAGTSPTITGWYWPNNSTYYHLRTISPQENLTVTGTTADNYITMTGGAVASAKDYVWGAPLKENHTSGATSHPITYDTSNGYAGSLYPAIGPTKNNIHITQFHMMTDLEIKLQTTTGADAVTLTGAKVELVNYANQANLMIGKGLVSGWADIKTTAQALTVVTNGSDYTWRTVPQHLSRGTNAADKVGLIITLTDGNIYEIKDLSTLPVKVNGATEPSYITFWEPGKKYVYNLTLKKTAIDRIEATVVDWETVTASYDDVKIQ